MSTKTGVRVAYLEAGATRLGVSSADYTWDRAERLREETAQVRRDNSIFAKYPRNEGESEQAWKDRIKPEVETENIRKEGEDHSDYLKRVLELKSDVPTLLPQFMNVIVETFALRQPTEDDLKKMSYIESKRFIFDVLSNADAICSDFQCDLVEK